MTPGGAGAWSTGLLVALCLPCGAQQPPRGGGSPSLAIVEGTVREADTDTPVEGATVRLDGSGSPVWTLTDSLGHYRVHAQAGSVLGLTVERIGYATLRMDSVRIEATMRLDFALTPKPVPLSRLTILGWADALATQGILSGGRRALEVTRSVASLVLDESRAAPLVSALMVGLDRGGRDGPNGGPSLPGGGGANALGVRGSLTRHGSTFVDGAPAQLAGPASYLADPFGERRRRVRSWDAGAPARVTGGLEYVSQVDERPGDEGPGVRANGDLDLVRAAGDVSRYEERWGAAARGRTTLPWASEVLGEGGHRSRVLALHAWAAPLPRQRLLASLSVRREEFPAGSAAGASEARSADLLRSLRWEARLGSGLLVAHAGAGRSGVELPPVSAVGTVPGTDLRNDGSVFGVEYSNPVSSSVEASVGGDRLAYRWSGTVSASGAVWGAFTEFAWRRPDSRLGARFGTRVERPTTQGGVRVSPRFQVDWRIRPDLLARIGSGTYHQLLLATGPNRPASQPPLPVFAGAVHHRATAILAMGSGALRVDGYLKRLNNVPGVHGRLEVAGGTLGVSAVMGARRVAAAATLERRREGTRVVWNQVATADVERTVAGSVALRVRVEASRNPGGLVLTGVADTTGALAGGPTTVGGTGTHPWSVRVDGELSHTIPGNAAVPRLRVYVQVLNAVGRELRPLFVEAASPLDPWLPRVVVIGAGVALGPARADRHP